MLFIDRGDAGRRLAVPLQSLHAEDIVALGIPRGGVPVAFEVATALGAPLDVIPVRKLGVPHQPELAFGAVGEDVRVINEFIVQQAQLTADEMASVERRERDELTRRTARFRHRHPRIPVVGRTVVIIDDGMVTGASARVACEIARAHGAARVVLAVPVAPREAVNTVRGIADEVICLQKPASMRAVGQWYRSFPRPSDDDIAELLDRAATGAPAAPRAEPGPPPLRDDDVHVITGNIELTGHLTIPADPIGMVVFAHPSGSSRYSPRNRYLAEMLRQAGLGTLLFDLLTPDEEIHRARVFDIDLLSARLVDVTEWLTRQPHTQGLRIGYFGTDTGAAAALRATTDPRVDIATVASRSGRPDLARDALTRVRTPTLLIAGGGDPTTLKSNQRAQATMSCASTVTVVPGADHLFTQPAALETVADLARNWFVAHLTISRAPEDVTAGRNR
ncbi:phosphoribosyltransferase family protein [Nocardia vaccinii]|uniref:phosphoribosyltransferase family protein n=1 Tax=Nocardia vaccinii TaxID=1822 RepID=UPI00082F63B4|nr:phosphoribosyltransferase family protein [Nocardia vaccinii]